MDKLLGVVTLLTAVPNAWAGEVHTRGTAGSWSTDPARGVLHGSIPNDTGYSFWPLGESVTTSQPTMVVAQIRYIHHVDYGGAGVALIDPRATHATQPNLRIELSEREDNVGVGGWLGNENHLSSGGSRKA